MSPQTPLNAEIGAVHPILRPERAAGVRLRAVRPARTWRPGAQSGRWLGSRFATFKAAVRNLEGPSSVGGR